MAYQTNWSVVLPKESSNVVINPSVEIDLTGYTAAGATMTRASGISYWGAYSVRAVTTSGQQGFYYTDSSLLLASGTTYTMSFYLNAVAGLSFQTFIATSGAVPLNLVEFVSVSGWNRVSFQYTETSTAQRRIYIRASDATTFYVDGLNCVATTDTETYIDGDQPGCVWNGAEHSSTSTRDGQYRQAGKIVSLDEYGLGIRQQTGIGMLPVQHITQEYGLADGALYRGSKVKPRIFQLTAQLTPDDLSDLHIKRDAFIDAIKLNLVGQQQELLLRYTGANTIRQIKALYEEGLGFDTSTEYLEVLPLRFLSTDPYFYEEGQQAAFLSPRSAVSGSYVTQRNKYGEWSNINSTFNSSVYAAAFDRRRGYYVFGGQFTSPVAYVAKYDPVTGTYSSLGGAAPNSSSNDIVIDDTTGDVYVGGAFTSVSGVANTHGIARWNRATNTWSAVGSGLANGVVLTLAFGNDRTLYIGGTFTAMSGVANTSRIAKYNPDTNVVSAMGSGLNSDVWDIVTGPDGYQYITGDFTSSERGLCYWQGTTFVPYGNLTTNVQGRCLQFGLDGALYWSFNGTSINGETFSYIAKWNGTQWLPLDIGISNFARAMAVDKQGNLIAGGDFFFAGNIALPSPIALWNGSQWYPIGYAVPSLGSSVRDIYLNPANDDLTLTWAVNAGTAKEYAATITNRGKADAYPTIYIDGPSSGTATLYFIKNYTTGDTIYFNTGLVLNANERFILQLQPGAKDFTSNFQGKIIQKIIPGSNMSKFRLLSGANRMSFFANSNSITVTLVWTPKHLSVDGGAQ